MKKTQHLFSILLAVVMVFTSVGMVFADETPPPVDDQSLLPPADLNYPKGTLYTNNGINFNWSDVPGADKYILELEYVAEDYADRVTVIKPVTIANKKNLLAPPTTATVTTKKPLAPGYYYWRITAVNTDVGIDPAGAGQTSDWKSFEIDPTLWSIGDMWPGVTTTSTAYSGRIDPKKGDGTNTDKPQLNWVVTNGTSGSLGASAQFKVTLSQGKNKWSQIVAGSTCTAPDSEMVCWAPFANFSGPTALSGLTAGVPYTWEVVGQEQPADATLFPTPSTTMAAVKDTVEYNPNDPAQPTLDKFPPLLNALVTDTMATNKPTFGWMQAAYTLPKGAVYQIVVEKDDTKTTPVAWAPAFTAKIIPNVTKIPASTQVACPNGGADCYWRFPGTFDRRYNYRWNVRVLAGAKYGPWASADNVLGPEGVHVPEFSAPGKPNTPIVTAPLYNNVDINPKPGIDWEESAYTIRIWDPVKSKFIEGHVPAYYYQIDLKRVAPAPLTKTISTEIFDFGVSNLEDILPTAYDNYGLPRGNYELVVSPKMKYQNGQAGVYPAVKSKVQKFVIGPAFPSNLAAAYDKTAKKMNVTFDKNNTYPAESVKYRILVKMNVGGSLWRWVKIGTYTGASCPASGATCTLQLPVYKPGTTQALENGTYAVQIQEALKEEGNIPAKNKLWGPFGPLSGDVTVAPF